ncbi:MAG: DUF5706 domain-containing protein [Rudaea sp.]|uniref:Pycsar system effector family protein n=1 Tax=Rudaea sp. TaxID=2136325 RepID=UPI0039E53728
MVDSSTQRGKEWFADIPERNTGDMLLRTAQQHHVSLSVMADTKASIVITVSSIVLTLSLGKFNDPDLRWSMLMLDAFTLLALLLAVVAVLPKYRPFKLTSEELPAGFNLLFMGHFAALPRERFLAEIARSMRTDGSVYFTMANDIYSLGTYLAQHKYRYLRAAYLSFLAGFVLALFAQAWRLLYSS